jgi:hypothetical protein
MTGSQQRVGYMASDESGPAGDQYIHGLLTCLLVFFRIFLLCVALCVLRCALPLFRIRWKILIVTVQ